MTQSLTTAFQTLPRYPAGNARNHVGSLIGKTIAVDPVHGSDFEAVYSPGGCGPSAKEQFTVTADNECNNPDGSGARIIEFTDRHGNTYYGNATRFTVVAGSAATIAPAAKTPAKTPAKQDDAQDTFSIGIMNITRSMCR